MAFTMKVSNEKIEGQEVIPPQIYELKLVAFKPKLSKSGTSTNLNPIMEVVSPVEYAGRKIFDNLNTSAAWTYPDFCHAFGLPMETDGKDSWLPGTWDGDGSKFKEDDPTTWAYKGPLVGRTAKVEVAVDNYNGKDGNKVRRYFCAVADCQTKFPKIRHSEDLLKRS
jgi:hypothetical protein